MCDTKTVPMQYVRSLSRSGARFRRGRAQRAPANCRLTYSDGDAPLDRAVTNFPTEVNVDFVVGREYCSGAQWVSYVSNVALRSMLFDVSSIFIHECLARLSVTRDPNFLPEFRYLPSPIT